MMLKLNYDGEIHIATYPSRLAKIGQNKKLLWSEFLGQLLTTTRTKETIREYFKMGREEQDTIKDVGALSGAG